MSLCVCVCVCVRARVCAGVWRLCGRPVHGKNEMRAAGLSSLVSAFLSVFLRAGRRRRDRISRFTLRVLSRGNNTNTNSEVGARCRDLPWCMDFPPSSFY